MTWWAKVFGGGIVQTVGDVVQAKIEAGTHQADADAGDVASARQFAAPGAGGQGVFNDLVDALNRLIRPVVTIDVFGGLAGWWVLPDLRAADPFWLSVATVIFSFWFGGRLLAKDLPAGIARVLALVAARRKG